MPPVTSSGSRRPARRSAVTARSPPLTDPRQGAIQTDDITSRSRDIISGTVRSSKITHPLEAAKLRMTGPPETWPPGYRLNPFDVHIRHSRNLIEQWLEWHFGRIPAQLAPPADLDVMIRMDCDFIIQACGFRIDWDRDRSSPVTKDISFEQDSDRPVRFETVVAGIEALVNIGSVISHFDIERIYPDVIPIRYIRQGLWDLSERLDVRDPIQMTAIKKPVIGIAAQLSYLSDVRAVLELQDAGCEGLAGRLLARAALRDRSSRPATVFAISTNAEDFPVIAGFHGHREAYETCARLVSGTYGHLHRWSQQQASREVERACDEVFRNIMADSAQRPGTQYANSDGFLDEKSDARRIYQCIETLRSIALDICLASPDVIPTYLLQEGCVNRLCGCLMALSWSLHSQEPSYVQGVLCDGVEGGLVERVRCLALRMKGRGVGGFDRVTEELQRYLVV